MGLGAQGCGIHPASPRADHVSKNQTAQRRRNRAGNQRVRAEVARAQPAQCRKPSSLDTGGLKARKAEGGTEKEARAGLRGPGRAGRRGRGRTGVPGEGSSQPRVPVSVGAPVPPPPRLELYQAVTLLHLLGSESGNEGHPRQGPPIASSRVYGA